MGERSAPSEPYDRAVEPRLQRGEGDICRSHLYFRDPREKNGKRARLAWKRQKRAAMIGRNASMQGLEHPSQTLWRVGVTRTTLYMQPTGTAEVAIVRSVRMWSAALVNLTWPN